MLPGNRSRRRNVHPVELNDERASRDGTSQQ
jgi:hypothetical protein